MCRVNFSTRAVYWRLLSSGEAQVVTVSLCMRSRSSYMQLLCVAIWQPQLFLCLFYPRVAVHVIEDTPTDCRAHVLTCTFAMGCAQPHNCRIWRAFHGLHALYNASRGLSIRPLQYNDFECGFCRLDTPACISAEKMDVRDCLRFAHAVFITDQDADT